MITAPFARLAVIIIGNISGVNPTATLNANTPASNQSPSVNPLIKNTTGTKTSIKRINSHEILFISFSKLVCSSKVLSVFSIRPIIVSFPVTKITAKALPLTTFDPIKTKRSLSSACFFFSSSSGTQIDFFSTDSLSPVKLDCWIKKSRVSINNASAGNMSPALNLIISPTTKSSIGTSICSPSRITVAVFTIRLDKLLAALSLFIS